MTVLEAYIKNEIDDISTSIDQLELNLLNTYPVVDMPVIHTFLKGIYTREIFMPAGTLCTSKQHNTEHPYVVLSGKVKVFIPEKGYETLEGGFSGITDRGMFAGSAEMYKSCS